jgi:selenocysteine-specific elongation factor
MAPHLDLGPVMTKRDLVIGTAGHIDHGKTALVRALTGVDTDRLPAEKQRGITIDLGFAALDLDDCQLALVDVPGHERFIRNMLAGATGLDLALLIVAADDSVMPQTREHLQILRLLRLTGGVIALTKCDLVEPSWLALVEDEVRNLVAGTFLENAAIVRTSATTGEGLGTLRDALAAVAATAPARDDPGLFRMAIDRSFTVAGHGTVVTGTVASGSVAVGDELALLPDGRSTRVRGLQRHEHAIERIGRGARAAVNLVGVHHTEIRRGQELATPGYLEPARTLSVELATGDDAPRPIRHRGRYRLHLGTAEVSATLAIFSANELGPHATTLGQLFLAEPVVAVSGQPFVLREESPPATLGGGRVLDPCARRVRRRDHVAIDRIDRLRSLEPEVRTAAALVGFGLKPWSDRALCRAAGLGIAEVNATLPKLVASGMLADLPLGTRRSVRVLSEVAAALEDRIVRALGRLHSARPRQSAIPRAHVAAEMPDLANDALISGLLDRLQARGVVVVAARTVALAGFQPKLSQGERKLKNELAETIKKGGFSPPDAAELAALAPGKGAVVPELLALLREEEQIIAISPELSVDFEVEADLRRRVRAKLGDGSSLAMSELRDMLGTTRKYAVPIGEYLDRIGLTIREGDTRRLGPAAENPTSVIQT